MASEGWKFGIFTFLMKFGGLKLKIPEIRVFDFGKLARKVHAGRLFFFVKWQMLQYVDILFQSQVRENMSCRLAGWRFWLISQLSLYPDFLEPSCKLLILFSFFCFLMTGDNKFWDMSSFLNSQHMITNMGCYNKVDVNARLNLWDMALYTVYADVSSSNYLRFLLSLW